MEILGNSPEIRAALDLAGKAAPTTMPVLIQGETGTGKELFARFVHEKSGRRGEFVPVDCPAIPDTLWESELFGHEKGVFTGADRRREGLIMTADGGTLFLDEVNNIPLSIQAKLLRTLQEGEVRPLGSRKATRIDARVVSASGQNLQKLVMRGVFRQDLFYRLAGAIINIPPLRDRGEDIQTLAETFLRRERYEKDLSPIVKQAISEHFWPGNVRELDMAMRRFAVFGDLQLDIKFVGGLSPYFGWPLPDTGIDLYALLTEITANLVAQAMTKAAGIKQKAADLLGLKRTTLVAKHRLLVARGLMRSDGATGHIVTFPLDGIGPVP